MSGPLTVLHLIETGGPGGAETVFRDLVTGLPPDRWRSLAVVPVVDWLHGALADRGVEAVVLDDDTIKSVQVLRSLLRRHCVDVVHAHLLGSSFYASLATFGTRVPVVCTFHGLPDFRGSGRLPALKLRVIARARNRMVFVSESLRQAALRMYSIPEHRTCVVHNGVPTANPTQPEASRAELGIGPNDFLLGAVGNVRTAKDYPNLLRAVSIVRQQGCPARLVVMGEGRGGPLRELLNLRSDLGLDDAVEFLGFRPDVPRFLSALDVFVLSSSSEGFSLSTAEALSHGRPVVATRSGGPEEIVQHEVTGLLVPPEDPKALAEAILRLLEHPDLATAMGIAGGQDVRDRFSMQRMIEAYDAIYTELAPGS